MKRENERMAQAFEVWYAADRRAAAVQERFSVSERAVMNWLRDWEWHARADARDQEAAKKAEKQAIARRVAVLEEQRKAGELLRRRGTEHFVLNKIEMAGDAIRAIKEGIALERQAEEFAAARLEVTGKDGGPIVVGDVGLARAELAGLFAALVDPGTADDADRAALAEDSDDPAV